jgi:serine/threonine-protein kinase
VVLADSLPLAPVDPELSGALDDPGGADDPARRYVRVGTLGTGGAGEVFAVEDRLLKRKMAVKRLSNRPTTDLTSAFLREARLLCALEHPTVTPVYAFGIDPSGRPLISMKRVDGETLSAWISREGPVRAGSALGALLDMASQLCDGLAAAHARGWVHADLKPGNLMRGPHGELTVLDWGNALPSSRWGTPLGQLCGTVGYLSPEQATDGGLGPHTDVYGVGACLFAALTRRPLFTGSATQIVGRLANGDGATVPPEVGPEPLRELVQACLAIDPADRPASAAALRARLDRVRRGAWDLPRQAVREGDTVITEGDSGDTAYLLIEGRLEVLQEGRGKVRELGPDDVFGEMAPLRGGRRTSTVRAVEPATLAVLSGEALRRGLAHSGLPGRFVGALVERLIQLEADRARP